MKDIRFLDPFMDHSRYRKVLAKYGGAFSFWDNIKMKGIGSPKWIYLGGLEEFDIIRDKSNPELPWFNMEILKEGFVMRINKRQQLAVAITKKEQLKMAKLEFFDLFVPDLGYSVLSGQLTLEVADRVISLAVSNRILIKTEDFFHKAYFGDLFEMSKLPDFPTFLQENPDKKDYYTAI